MYDDPETKKDQQRFLKALSKYLSQPEAARRIGLNADLVYNWARESPEFREQCARALEAARGYYIGQLVDACMGEGEYADLSITVRAKILQKVALDLNPELTGRAAYAAAKHEKTFFFSNVPSAQRLHELPEPAIDGEVKEIPDD